MSSVTVFTFEITPSTFSGLWHACFDGFHDRGHQYEVGSLFSLCVKNFSVHMWLPVFTTFFLNGNAFQIIFSISRFPAFSDSDWQNISDQTGSGSITLSLAQNFQIRLYFFISCPDPLGYRWILYTGGRAPPPIRYRYLRY